MSSGGQIIGGIVGGVIGSLTGNPFLGAQLGMMAGGMLDPPKGPTIEGPRLEDLSVQTSTYGAVIPRVYGTVTVNGNVFWLENNQIKPTITKRKSGGKGGGSKTTTLTTTYSATFAVGLCKGPIVGILRMWVGPDLIYHAGTTDLQTILASNDASPLFTVHLGTDSQLPDARMQATLGVANTPAYRGLAYVVFNDLPLARYGNSLVGAQVRCEVLATGAMGPFSDSHATPVSGKTWIRVAYNQIALTVSTSGSVAYSTTGDTWLSLSNVTVPQVTWQVLGSCGVNFILAGYNSWTNEVVMATSVNGFAWIVKTPIYLGPASLYGFSALHNTVCVCAGTKMMVSTDAGDSWEAIAMPGFTSWYAVANNGSRFVAISAGGTGARIAISEDGKTWADAGPGYFSPGVLSGSPSGLVMLSQTAGSTAYFSSDGLSWSPVTLPFSAAFSSVAWSGSHYVAVQYSGAYACLSADGMTWTSFALPALANNLFSVGGSGLLFAVGLMDYVVKILPRSGAASAAWLSEVVSQECLQSGLLSSGDIDVTALAAQQVRGYRVGSVGAIRAALEPLQAAWPFDVVQHGYQIKFVARGGASVVTIPAADLDAHIVSTRSL